MVDIAQIHRMLEAAEPRANRINEVVDEADDLRALVDEQMTIAALVWAVSLAKLTDLNFKDFVMLAQITFDRTGYTRKEAKTHSPKVH